MRIVENIRDDEIIRFHLDFDDDMKLSMNKVWSWGNWTQWLRKSAAELWHWDIERLLDDSKKITRIKEKVDIFFTLYFSTGDSWGKRQLDSSNCSPIWKMIEDSFKYDSKKNPRGFIDDDTNDKVGWFCLRSAQMTLAERKLLETSYVEVSVRPHNPNL